jgi:penicillin-binding protein 1C
MAWRRPTGWRGALGLLALSAALLLALDALLPPPVHRAAEVSQVVRDREGRVMRIFPVEEGRWRLRADLDAIDPDFLTALIAYEDERFYSHGGVDPLAVLRAARSNLAGGRVISGASTLSMQTARLLEPRPRTLGAKLLQSLRAVQLEWRYSKEEILELYLTLAPYGGNLEGVRAASWAYFGREPDELTADQIALLIALPQSPEARRPDRRPEAAVAARSIVLDRLAGEGLVPVRYAEEAAQEPAPGRRAFPALAWHAAEEALRRAPDGVEIRTTLDYALQAELETVAAEAALGGADGVQTAILVVDTQTREVRAAVGSAYRSRPGGWIDLTDRARSPGSTLKPFIYGLAFDDGIAAPGTRISDLPRRFADYRPKNFDRRFRGDVTIAEALQHSLNLPAVAALDGIGARRFTAALNFAGATPIRPRRGDPDEGLAVALGGAGMTARDLALLYAALAEGGEARPLRWLAGAEEAQAGYGLMSAESAEEILAILRSAPHPSGRAPAALTRDAPQIAFKTGTSYGYRDAWAAGTGGGYAVVVWTGRPDGAPRPGVTGRSGALPLLFRVFDRLDMRREQALPERLMAERRTTPAPLRAFDEDRPPQILFPPDGAEIWADRADRRFVLAAQGETPMAWYADGDEIERNAAGDAAWTPPGPGFYRLEAVDRSGRRTVSRVRVITD